MNILDVALAGRIAASGGGGGGSGTDNYNDLSNLPQINGETLAGNKTAENLGLQDALTFDSAPTEDSTNPVESGGVYNALAGKQDNLTFDDDPTENSTNPVKSGGVYSALAGKQDNLTFDGVYNASTNKAATESTVTNAIAGLDVSVLSVDADETISSISETDGKINVTKQDIAIASNQVTAMTGYTKPSSAPATPAIQPGDTANAAIGKLEYKADVNQTNILSVQERTDQIQPKVSFSVDTSGWYRVFELGEVAYASVLGGNDNSCNILLYRDYGNNDNEHHEIKLASIFQNIEFTDEYSKSNVFLILAIRYVAINNYAYIDVYYNGEMQNGFYFSITNNGARVPWKAVNTVSRVAESTTGETVVASYDFNANYDLTRLEAEDRAALAEVVDSGAKNKLPRSINSGAHIADNVTFTVNSDGSVTVNSTGAVSDSVFINYYNGKMSDIIPAAGVYKLFASDGTGNAQLKVWWAYTDTWTVVSETPNSTNTAYISESDLNRPITVRIVVFTGNAISNAKVYPMICTLDDWKISQKYAQHALPNTDLTRLMTPFFTVPINHNMIYRGQNLGDTLTADQDTALSSGNFTDLYLGDYWTKSVDIPAFYEVTTAEPSDWSTNYTSYYTKSGDTYTPVSGDTAPAWAANTYYERLVPAQTVTLKAVIADFDTFYAGYASGYAAINTHHAAVVVHGFNNVVWNKTNTTAGGYTNSLIHKWLVTSVLPQIETWFGSAKVLSHQKLLTNAITGDAASGWAWSSQKISLLSENQMYGSKVWGNSKASNGGYEPGEAFKHLNVFNHIDANLLFGNKNIWLRDIASAVGAAGLIDGGVAGSFDASYAGFAPAALILLS